MLSKFSTYLEILRVQFKNNFVREAVYRTNFFAMVTVDLIWLVLEFALFTVIYSNVPEIAGWNRHQVYFFLGIFFSSDALFTIFFQRNFWMFSDLVNKGDLDILLTKPVNPLFLALTRWFNLTALFNFVLGLIIANQYSDRAGFPGGVHWLLLIFWFFIGVVAAVMIRFVFSVWVFWTERSWAFSRLYYQFYSFATKPDVLYPPVIRYTILTVLPFAFIGSLPARALLHGLRLYEYILVVSVLIALYFVNRKLWKAGLRRYQSASS
ncbi:MAG: hypothetical protein A3K03_04975 [Bdellovibrionales bacterium RIFOXYD1_FULL_44_7]|nr:MAG: hypothetical protein A3K03_04975 [Bdellovibrionales bacterium RIFOXYD1_FULL_44_7]